MSLLEPRQIVPSFTLSSVDGREFRSAELRGRRNLVLIFPSNGESDLTAELATHLDELAEENVQVLIIVPGASQSADGQLPFPVLLDEYNQVRNKFGAEGLSSVYITDQYGEIYSVQPSEGVDAPGAEEMLASLRHINAACPE